MGQAEHWGPRPEKQQRLCQHCPWAAAARWRSHSAILHSLLQKSWVVSFISRACSAFQYMSRSPHHRPCLRCLTNADFRCTLHLPARSNMTRPHLQRLELAPEADAGQRPQGPQALKG